MKRYHLFLVCVLLAISGCKKDDDNDSTSSTPGGNVFVEKFIVTVNGTTYNVTNPTVSHSTSPDYIDIIGESGGVVMEFEAANDLSTGSFTINSSTTTKGFAVVIGSDGYFCSNCQGNIQIHDETANFFKVTLSGTLKDLFSSETRQLDGAEIAVFY